jgi:hypothetical protein
MFVCVWECSDSNVEMEVCGWKRRVGNMWMGAREHVNKSMWMGARECVNKSVWTGACGQERTGACGREQTGACGRKHDFPPFLAWEWVCTAAWGCKHGDGGVGMETF